MKFMHNRLLCFFLAAILLLSCVPALAMPVRAEDFPNTYVNTGNQRADLLGVAATQVGYREGSGGYTKYGDWFGSPRMDWCGAFISWCANQAGIPQSVLKKNGFASAEKFNLERFTVNNHLPQGGDLFFKNNGNHTGIVYYIEGDYFWTLEGNTWEGGGTDGVYSRKRSLYGEYYFASPKYTTDGSSTKHNYIKKTEAAHPHKEYYQCADCGNTYYTGGKATVSDCRQCIQESCSHQYGNYKKVNDSNHSATCSKCGLESRLSHNWKDDKVITEVTCEKPGTKQQKCQQCNATKQLIIPQTNEHKYTEWVRLDENKHIKKCETCGKTQEEAHRKGSWQTNVFEHWYDCDICNGRGGNEIHSFSGDCETACSVCDYVSPTGHRYLAQKKRDATYHWQVCSSCNVEHEKTKHQFEDACDSICDDCGYVREVTHEYMEQWKTNATGHWKKCNLCGHVEPAEAHVLGAAATENEAQYCVICGFEAVPALPHTHKLTYEQHADSHVGVCECGAKLQPEKHIWDMASKTCTACAMAVPLIPDDSHLLLIAAGVAALLVVLILVALIVSAVKQSMMRAAARAAFREMAEDFGNAASGMAAAADEKSSEEGLEPPDSVSDETQTFQPV